MQTRNKKSYEIAFIEETFIMHMPSSMKVYLQNFMYLPMLTKLTRYTLVEVDLIEIRSYLRLLLS